MAEFDPQPVTLTGEFARLEPLAQSHAQGLYEAGRDEGIWTYLPVGVPENTAAMETFVREAIDADALANSVPFAIIDVASGRPAGTTRYLDIQRAHRGLEIGWTWLGPAYQRTPVNTECKLLLLQQAFESLGAIRVQLKTDLRNVRSQKAIERIGARKEGVLRNHMVVQGGYQRDSVYYSIVDREWPAVRDNLLARLGRRG